MIQGLAIASFFVGKPTLGRLAHGPGLQPFVGHGAPLGPADIYEPIRTWDKSTGSVLSLRAEGSLLEDHRATIRKLRLQQPNCWQYVARS